MKIPYGLTDEEARRLTCRGLNNKAPGKTTKNISNIIFDNFFNYFNILNIFLFILIIFTGQYKNGMFIGVLVTNTVTGIVQELRAKKILDKLSVVNESNATVVREGRKISVNREAVVKGDLLYFSKGCQVCVDCIVTAAEALYADESMLTGENIPVSKQVGDILLSGSFISSGECYAEAETVGEHCYSAILTVKAKQRKKTRSEILADVEKIVRTMSFVIIPAGVLLYLAQMYLSKITWQSNIVRTVASMIGMLPNGLVLLITAAYTLGVYRVSKKGALVQEPAVMEAFANIDTMCFDKTGTLTDSSGKIRPEIPDFLCYLNKNNIKVKIISGDKPEYVTAIAKDAGINNFSNCCNLTGLNKEQTMAAALQYEVFSRSSPEQKSWIVEGLQQSGEKVAMAGDGVNDVLALKNADCGISPVSGTDAARGVAGIILMNSDFSALKKVFEEGRGAINNIEKTACLYLNKTAYSLILTLFTIIYTLFGQVRYPFEPIHMTVISVLAIGIPSLLITLQKNTTKLPGRFLSIVLSRAVPFGVSIALSEILIMVLYDLKIISAPCLSFASYAVAGCMAFALLFFVCKPHTKFSLTYMTILSGLFICTLFMGNLLNFGGISLFYLLFSAAVTSVALVFAMFLMKNIKF